MNLSKFSCQRNFSFFSPDAAHSDGTLHNRNLSIPSPIIIMARSSYGKPSVNEGKKPVRRKKSTVTVEARKRKTSKTTVQEDSARTTVTVEAEKKKGDDSKKKKLLNGRPPLVRGFVETTLNLGVKGLIAEFRSKKRVLATDQMTEFMAQQANNRNRYKDVGCLDKTRVKLALGPVEYIQ